MWRASGSLSIFYFLSVCVRLVWSSLSEDSAILACTVCWHWLIDSLVALLVSGQLRHVHTRVVLHHVTLNWKRVASILSINFHSFRWGGASATRASIMVLLSDIVFLAFQPVWVLVVPSCVAHIVFLLVELSVDSINGVIGSLIDRILCIFPNGTRH